MENRSDPSRTQGTASRGTTSGESQVPQTGAQGHNTAAGFLLACLGGVWKATWGRREQSRTCVERLRKLPGTWAERGIRSFQRREGNVGI